MAFFTDVILFHLLIGTSFGFILFLIGAGLSLTMGLMRIVNLAHGAMYMVGAYVGLSAAKFTGSFTIGVFAGGISVGLLGLIMEMGLLRRLYKRELDQVLLTIGIIYILTNLAQWIWGTMPMGGIIPAVLSGSIPLGKLNFPVFRLAIIVFGLFAAVGLWLFQEKTRIGAMIRAGMDNKKMTLCLGINLKVIFTGVFAFGSFVAGFCGLIGAPFLGINLAVGWDALLLGMIVIIVGGVGSVQGALAGGLIIGIVNAFGQAFFPDVAYFTLYLLLIIILVFRPAGLLGKVIKDVKSDVSNAPVQGYGGHSLKKSRDNAKNWNPFTWLFPYTPAIGFGLLLLVCPLILPIYLQTMATKILIFAVFAMSLDLILGYTGLLSLGHAAFFGASGYATGIMMVHFGIESIWILMPLTLLVTGVLAVFIGYLALRVSKVYFLLITLAFGQLLSSGAIKWRSLTGGTDGLIGIAFPSIGLPGFQFMDSSFYYLALIIFLISFFLLRKITVSSFGRALVGIRENEQRMKGLGFNTWLHKYIAFIISGLFAGLAGMLCAQFYGIMVPEHLGITSSASAMLMVVIGSPGTMIGPVIGCVIVVLLEHFASIYAPDRWPLMLGGVFVISVVFVRGGVGIYLMAFWNRVLRRYGYIEG